VVLINLLVPNAGRVTSRIVALVGLSAIVGGIIAWVTYDDDLLDTAGETARR
jgi:hypothetical protein